MMAPFAACTVRATPVGGPADELSPDCALTGQASKTINPTPRIGVARVVESFAISAGF
jgi:hypothetical protein